MSKTRNMSQGPITKQLIYFMLPLLGASLIQQLYNTVDLIFVGQVLGSEASAAVGASSLLITCLIGFFSGMSVGSGIISARFFGAGQIKKLKRSIHTSITFSFFGGLSLMVMGIFLAPWLLELLDTPPKIMHIATGYIRIYLLSMVSIITFNIGSGIIRSLGNSSSPMFYQLIGGLTNVLANTVFIVFLNLGVYGAAMATFFSQSVSMVLVLRHLHTLNPKYSLQRKQLKMEPKILQDMLKIGIPAGIQAMAITFSNLFIQSQINGFGIQTMAAFAAYFKVELIMYLPILSFGQAISTFISQNIGAKKVHRIAKGTNSALMIGVIITLFLSAVSLVFSNVFFGIFNPDPKVIEIGKSLVYISFPFYFIYVFLEIYASSIRGMGQALLPMLIILINMCGVRLILLMYLLAQNNVPQTIAKVYPITWCITSICLYLAYVFYYKKTVTELKSESFLRD